MFTLPGVRRHIFDDQILAPEQTADIVEKSVTLFRERGLGLWIAERQLRSKNRSRPSIASRPSVGFCGFWFFRDPPELELLYGVVDAQVGRGYGREIARAMIAYGFDTLNLPAIRASCDTAHSASRKLLEALGFSLTREARIADLDTAFYELERGRASSFVNRNSGPGLFLRRP